MKKSVFLVILALIVVLSACGETEQKNTEVEKVSVQDVTDEQGSVIGTVTVSPQKAYEEGTSSEAYIESAETIYATVTFVYGDGGSTTKTAPPETYKTAAPSASVYDLKVKYKDIAAMKKSLAKYKTIDDVLKEGKIKDNAICINPFREENLDMIFEQHMVFIPKLLNDYKFKNIYLSSRNFFLYEFTGKDGKSQSIKVYATLNSGEKTNRFTLSFKSNQGDEIYKNVDGKYCWFLYGKYVVVYSGSDKDFINNLYFERYYY